MTFSEKIKLPIFWRSVLLITIPFFIVLIILTLLFNSFSSIIHFDFEAINAKNFADGKWKAFVLTKLVLSFLYGIWITNRNIK